ncbi:glycerol dehydratase reactivase beta/small subunit family protein [Moorella sp. ACPs]|jgi:hypothetical protein|uniref:glycerol dehydratase reactivase beta/small subunit family protein n=1 Tax=Neomoorella carbonis TaxID=3062783 RepID=UPI003250BD83
MREERSKMEPPSIIIFHSPGEGSCTFVQQVLLGIEEEGLPASAIERSGSSIELAEAAAGMSAFGVGVGIDEQGNIALTHYRMPQGQPVFHVSGETSSVIARIVGTDAARLVKGRPLVSGVGDSAALAPEANMEALPQDKEAGEKYPVLDSAQIAEVVRAALRQLSG